MQSQVNELLEGPERGTLDSVEVLRRFHRWTIERTNAGICICDGGFFTYWVTIHSNGRWDTDTELQHAGIISWLNKHAKTLWQS